MRATIQISSRENAHLKEARQIRDGKRRDKIFIEGMRLVDEAFRSGVAIESLFLSIDGMRRASPHWESVDRGEVYQLPDSVFQSIADTVTSQGIVALAERPETGQMEVEKRLSTAAVPLVAYLHQTNNPSNLGAVIRTAEAAGVAGVIVSKGSADAFSPKALRSAMGASFRFPIWTDADIGEALAWVAHTGLQTIATEISAVKSYADVDWKRPAMLFLGSEAHGLSESGLEGIDEKIMIPMEGSVESLNLAVACGIILFEARRQNILR